MDYTAGICKLSGDLTIQRAGEVFSRLDFSSVVNDQMIVDFSRVKQSDSAALAVMLEWVNQATMNQKRVTYEHVPEQLMRLIKMAKLEQILDLA